MNTTMWHPAPAADWEREALPIGNGALGAMVFGGVQLERLQFNEKTLWSGGPGSDGYHHGNWLRPRPGAIAAARARIDADGRLANDDAVALLGQPRRGYGAYLNFGELELDIDAGDSHDYRRELDLADAIARVSYQAGDVRFTREYFASHPAGVLVGRLTADRPGCVSFTLRLLPGQDGATLSAADACLTMRGALADNGLRYEAQVQVTADGGAVSVEDDRITVTGADSAWFVLAAGTDYASAYPGYRGDDPHDRVRTAVEASSAQPFQQLKAAHIADHRQLFDRVTLDLGSSSGLSVDDLRRQGGPALDALLFDFGRYLLIASSRPGSLPANLQGVWNNSNDPPWGADYHTNINLQMNYWPAEVTNLAETALPLFDFIDALLPPGRATAREMFGASGWVVHNETTPYGFTGVHDWPTAFWFPEAAAWLAQHLHEHYLFSGDKVFLREQAYPVMREAALFWLDNLHTDPIDGALVASPAFSPEHGEHVAGTAMAQQIIDDVLTRTAEAADDLDVDAELAARLRATLARLDPGLRIGSWGQLQEWKTDLDDPADEHRHVSQLFALHPGRRIVAGTDLATAAARSLTARGDGGTGWSKAWKINFWARLRDGDRAHRLLTEQLSHSTLPNLFCDHPPFQIDGNFGAAAGIAEMLLQSHHGVIDILPALPAAWPDGEVTGLRARGGAIIGIRWRDGEAISLTLHATTTKPLRLHSSLFPHASLTDRNTGEQVLGQYDGSHITFPAQAGHRYEAGENSRRSP